MKRSTLCLVMSALLAMGACGDDGGGDGGNSIDAGSVADADTTPDAFSCPSGTVDCAGVCIDPLTDREYCGATACEGDNTDGEECAAGFVCEAGACAAFACEATGVSGCNPLTQAGCEVGEKCAQLVASASPFLASTSCVPDGTAAIGDTCTTCGDGTVGYDSCAAGSDCQGGRCTEICSRTNDTCREPGETFGEGSYCTLFADLFSDEIGLCISACNPTDDETANMTVTNNSCEIGEGCRLVVTGPAATCSNTPAPAIGTKQNQDCYGPAAGSCYLNGCASGFAPLLPDDVGQAATTNTCARYCTPSDTYIGNVADLAGVDAKCGATAMLANGSGALGGVGHECRYIQSLFGAPDVPATLGICAPVVPWYDCAETYDFTGLQSVVDAAADTAAANAAFNTFCYGAPEPPQQGDEMLARCQGFRFGCTSLATRQPIIDKLNPPAAAPVVDVQAWLEARTAARE